MIEYSVNTDQSIDRSLMYFAGDGSWGTADDIVLVDITELDGHFTEVIDELNEWQLPDFMRWYVDNQTHDQQQHSYTACRVCELWDSGMNENEILEDLENEDA
jgi:hypothetical protein